MHSIASLRFLLAASQVLASNGFWLYLDEHGIINTAQKLRPFLRSSNAHHLNGYFNHPIYHVMSVLKRRLVKRMHMMFKAIEEQ
jgi:hypothetical protein